MLGGSAAGPLGPVRIPEANEALERRLDLPVVVPARDEPFARRSALTGGLDRTQPPE